MGTLLSVSFIINYRRYVYDIAMNNQMNYINCRSETMKPYEATDKTVQ